MKKSEFGVDLSGPGKRIRKAREGIKLPLLLETLGMKAATLYKYERGEKIPGDFVILLHKTLREEFSREIDLHFLLTGETPTTPEPAAVKLSTSQTSKRAPTALHQEVSQNQAGPKLKRISPDSTIKNRKSLATGCLEPLSSEASEHLSAGGEEDMEMVNIALHHMTQRIEYLQTELLKREASEKKIEQRLKAIERQLESLLTQKN